MNKIKYNKMGTMLKKKKKEMLCSTILFLVQENDGLPFQPIERINNQGVIIQL
jgi:hypothetical protein